MARRGPKPEPASVKLAKGNSGRRPIGADPVVEVDASGAIVPPSWLKAEALDIWQRIAPRLIGLKLLGLADIDTFARYCRNYARWLKMQRTLDEEGETYESVSAHGTLKRAHPAFLISDRLDRKLESVEDRFGLNPSERQRIFAARAAQGAAQGELLPPTPQTTVATAREAPRRGSPIGLLN